jgi:hypothetical protein
MAQLLLPVAVQTASGQQDETGVLCDFLAVRMLSIFKASSRVAQLTLSLMPAGSCLLMNSNHYMLVEVSS